MNILQSLLEITFFLFAIFICFYLPGKFLFTKLKPTLSSPEDLFLPFVLGAMIFTLVANIFSWLKLEFIVLPLFLLVALITLRSKKFLPKNIDKFHHWPLLIVVILSIIFSLSMFTIGVYGDSISYRRDDLWHLALINELKVNFPPDNPGFAGVQLRGYHFFYNFVLAKISNIFLISPISLHFHFFPLFIAVLWGLGVYALMFAWSKKIGIALWAVFLTMFGGSFAFILHLRGHENLSLDSAFGIQQPAASLINPPFAISIIIVIAILLAMYKYFSTQKKSWLIAVVLCIGLVSMFKVYAGIIMIGSFSLFTIFQLVRKRYSFLLPLFFIGILFIATYWVLADRQSKLIFFPLWAPHDVLNSNMPWYGYAEKMYTYTKLSVTKGIVETELYALYVFFFGNLGTRLIGLLLLAALILKKHKKPSVFAFNILTMALISILIPLFFIQSGKVFEIIQMTWYFLFFTSLFTAFGFHVLFSLARNRIIKIFLFTVIIILTLPSAYENYKGYFGAMRSHRSSLSDSYFQAMRFLKSKGTYNETVIEIPSKNIGATKKDVLRWYRSSSPAIVAFANKRSYLSNEYIDFAGVNIAPRIELIRKIILLNDMFSNDSAEYLELQEKIKQEFKKHKISFIYSPYPLSFAKNSSYINKIYKNQAATIYRVDVKQ